MTFYLSFYEKNSSFFGGRKLNQTQSPYILILGLSVNEDLKQMSRIVVKMVLRRLSSSETSMCIIIIVIIIMLIIYVIHSRIQNELYRKSDRRWLHMRYVHTCIVEVG